MISEAPEQCIPAVRVICAAVGGRFQPGGETARTEEEVAS